MQTYDVLMTIDHGTSAADVARYPPGSLICLDDGHAAPLLAVNAIAGPVKPATDEAAESRKKGSPA